ncbi:UNVERIFIED_CONTAM: hypothetical protein K2H54_056019 [Gekko kuhli]
MALGRGGDQARGSAEAGRQRRRRARKEEGGEANRTGQEGGRKGIRDKPIDTVAAVYFLQLSIADFVF